MSSADELEKPLSPTATLISLILMPIVIGIVIAVGAIALFAAVFAGLIAGVLFIVNYLTGREVESLQIWKISAAVGVICSVIVCSQLYFSWRDSDRSDSFQSSTTTVPDRELYGPSHPMWDAPYLRGFSASEKRTIIKEAESLDRLIQARERDY